MIREMKHGEEGKVRELLARLDYEDQTFWRKQIKTLEECFFESSKIPISGEVRGRSVIFVAEEEGTIVGLCWCTIVDRGIDKQGEVAEFFVEREFRGKGVGRDLMNVAKQLFIREKVEVAFAWTHHGNEAAIKLYKDAGFKEVDQVVVAFVPSKQN
ncbi:GNAT family N-acetyltransferase [Candidatus Bathyarchaeota archaeon]|nr:GNAT family N-acetyltransferase [Candidatus Bathyarchaeota archaeon]